MDLDNHTDFPYPLIQVAGVHDLEEAHMLVDAGADLIGIPLRLTVNAEDLSERAAARISRRLPGKCCLITYLNKPQEIADLARFLELEWVQLHGDVDPQILPTLRRLLPQTRFIKSLVIGRHPVPILHFLIQEFAPHVDAFITDTFDPESGAEGATGKAHDWSISREICRISPRPVILAGGLGPDNVAAAIQAVQPHGVDVHTGIEDATGRKCPRLAHRFIEGARTAFA